MATIALFVSLGGTAVAAAPVARALFANNAGKLQGKTLKQVAATPGPASSAAALASIASAPFSLGADEEKDISISCPAGQKAITGGWTTPNAVLAADSRPTADGTWTIFLINLSSSTPASGTLVAVCLA